MKKLIFIIAVLSLAAFGALAQTPRPAGGGAPAAAAQPIGGAGAEGKIAIINSSAFNSEIGELKIKLDSLAAELDPKRKEIEADQNEFNSLKTKIQAQGGTVNAQTRDQWVGQAQDLEKRIKRKAEDYEAQAQRRLSEVTQPVYEKIGAALSKYATSRGIAIVIDGVVAQQQQFLLYALPTSDITSDFIAEYNKSNPAGAATAPAKPAK